MVDKLFFDRCTYMIFVLNILRDQSNIEIIELKYRIMICLFDQTNNQHKIELLVMLIFFLNEIRQWYVIEQNTSGDPLLWWPMILIRRLNKKIRITCETGSNPMRNGLFSDIVFPLKFCFASGQRFPQRGRGAESEYVIFIHRTLLRSDMQRRAAEKNIFNCWVLSLSEIQNKSVTSNQLSTADEKEIHIY